MAVKTAPAVAGTHPTCANNGTLGAGYLYAGFSRTTNLIPVGGYAEMDVADFGSSLDPSDLNQGGHVALWLGETDPSVTHWVQGGITWDTWSLTDPTGQTPPFVTQDFLYTEIHDSTGEHLLEYPVLTGTYYTLKISRSATHTYTITVGGFPSATKTFGSAENLTAEQLEGENLQNTWSSPEPCNIADQAFEHLAGTNFSSIVSSANYSAGAPTKFDMLYLSGCAPSGVFESPWNTGGQLGPAC